MTGIGRQGSGGSGGGGEKPGHSYVPVRLSVGSNLAGL